MRTAPTKTPDQFLSELEAAGLSVASWARDKNLPVMTVYHLCLGRLTGTRGKAREVAQAMGLVSRDTNRKTRKVA